MAVTLISLSNFKFGILSDEIGINAENITLEVQPEINEWVPGINGQSRGKVVGDPMGDLTIEGEYASTDAPQGILASVFPTAFVPVNTMSYFGRTAGGFYPDSFTITRNRSSLQKVSAKFSSRFQVA